MCTRGPAVYHDARLHSGRAARGTAKLVGAVVALTAEVTARLGRLDDLAVGASKAAAAELVLVGRADRSETCMPGTDFMKAPRKRWTCALAALLLAACHAAGNDTDRHEAEASAGTTLEAGPSTLASDASGHASLTDAASTDGSLGTEGSGPSELDGAGDTAPVSAVGCDQPGLVWKSAAKTNYESYPAPGSDECVKYNGCEYLGQFQACENTMPESWVKAHDIASVFPLQGLELHNLCLRAGGKTMVVTAIDTCSDSDCEGCCTKNRPHRVGRSRRCRSPL